MKLKAAFRYQAVELVQSTAVFCLIIGAIIVAIALFGLVGGSWLSVPNLGFLPYLLMPLLALSTFQGDVRFLMQMGLTRPQIIASTAASLGAACLFLALVEAACAVFVSFWPQMQSLYLMSYGLSNGPVLDFLFMFLGCAAASGAGLALAALQMRFGARRVVLSLGAAIVAVFMVLPSVLPPLASLPTVLLGAAQTALGFGEAAHPVNPFLTFAAAAVLGVVVAWAAVRRIEMR